jgi:hypothetical protein
MTGINGRTLATTTAVAEGEGEVPAETGVAVETTIVAVEAEATGQRNEFMAGREAVYVLLTRNMFEDLAM